MAALTAENTTELLGRGSQATASSLRVSVRQPVRFSPIPKPRVVLINPPWASHRRPSIQLGLLAEIARKAGFVCETAHANLDLASQLGVGLYGAIAEHRASSFGEWLFAEAAFEHWAPPPEHFLDRFGGWIEELLRRSGSDVSADDLVAFRRSGARAFADRIAIDFMDFDVVGISSTFQQTAAAAAIAAAIRRRHHDALIVLGGANTEGEMGLELLRIVPAFDLLVSGEGDEAFPALLHAVQVGADLRRVPNLILRSPSETFHTARLPPLLQLDSTPIPDYREYFDRAERLGLISRGARRDIDIPIESSRGCWWGEKSHCTFCGLNGETMSYRTKSAERVSDELNHQARQYRSFRFEAVDNILDRKHMVELLPKLVSESPSFDLFYEVKSGLSPEELQLLAAAGVRRIQPGIESLSSPVLRLMRKGVRAIANVNLLRWSKRLGIDVQWNLLWGFPGETEEHYEAQTSLAMSLLHLQPPVAASRIWIERFSPLYKTEVEQGRRPLPERSLTTVFPAHTDLDRLAYFFEYDLPGALEASVYDPLRNVVEIWKQRYASSTPARLAMRWAPGFLQIEDTRHEESSGTFTFEDETADLYVAISENPCKRETVIERFPVGSRNKLTKALEILIEAGFVMRDGELVLALAIPAPSALK